MRCLHTRPSAPCVACTRPATQQPAPTPGPTPGSPPDVVDGAAGHVCQGQQREGVLQLGGHLRGARRGVRRRGRLAGRRPGLRSAGALPAGPRPAKGQPARGRSARLVAAKEQRRHDDHHLPGGRGVVRCGGRRRQGRGVGVEGGRALHPSRGGSGAAAAVAAAAAATAAPQRQRRLRTGTFIHITAETSHRPKGSCGGRAGGQGQGAVARAGCPTSTPAAPAVHQRALRRGSRRRAR